MRLHTLLNDNGPEEVFIFYSFLLFNRKNELVVVDKKDLRKTFFLEVEKTNNKKFLSKDVRKDLKNDVLRSYLYIKNKYF